MVICVIDRFFVLYAEQQVIINRLCGELLILRAGWLCFRRAWKVFKKFCPLCYKQVIALSPRRNTRENLSLILLGLVRLHILKHRKGTSFYKQKICLEKHLFAWESKIHSVAASRKNLYSEAIPFINSQPSLILST